MLILDRSKNDTSVVLDLLRASAAQIVCIGHALNFAALGKSTQLPTFGVLLFFLISGFLIAYTLATKSQRQSYGILEYGIERFARIYTPYLPAIFLIALIEFVMRSSGYSLGGGAHDAWTLFGSLIMRQNMPGWPHVSDYGTAGQMTSVAAEFHIYYFVGGLFFILKGRNVILSTLAAVIFASVPLAYFLNIPGSDRSLFVMWLIGFSVCYVVSSITIDRRLAALSLVGFAWCSYQWATNRGSNDYDLANYPMLGLSFLFLMILTQYTKGIPELATKIISFFADYSYSLFLVHLTLIRMMFALMPPSGLFDVLLVVAVTNLAAYVFYLIFERHYHRVARLLKRSARAGYQ
ncbi:acyltransferase [Bradyrhizobium sp. F1.13.3]|uniref:acyltransferase family protein n=1 Tax=Bradyrhizobium sp. F1.13.3 TaxID=3156351 RepID=UPI0033926790